MQAGAGLGAAAGRAAGDRGAGTAPAPGTAPRADLREGNQGTSRVTECQCRAGCWTPGTRRCLEGAVDSPGGLERCGKSSCANGLFVFYFLLLAQPVSHLNQVTVL